MEPRSWKWIQAIVVIVAAVIGIGIAMRYQNRPPGDKLLVPAVTSTRKKVLRPSFSDVIPPAAAPSKSENGFASDDTASLSAPVTATPSPRLMVDPMTHLQVPPPSAAPPPGLPSEGASGPSLSQPSAAPAAIPSTEGVSPGP